MMHNSLFLNRLLIFTEAGQVAYNEPFHRGINIIRGNNSSGKSTITHFIFYVLGGDFIDFVPEAKLCSSVYAEVEMNGATLTLRRELDKGDDDQIKRYAAMYIYWGGLDESLSPPPGQHWEKYGYRSTSNRKSFSNVLFDNLDIPIVKGDSNITMHQILRLLYVDQESPTSSLFYYEHFDSQLTRETVSDLLLGVYNEELYESKKRLIDAQKEYEAIRLEIRTTKQFFSDPLSLDPEHIKTKIENKEHEISAIEEEIVKARSKKEQTSLGDSAKLRFQTLAEESLKQRNNVLRLREEIVILEAEIEDSEYFLETLRGKIKALRHSIATRDFLGSLPVQFCPECLTKIDDSRIEGENKCKLCKEPIDESLGVLQARRMEQEINSQIKESGIIQEVNRRNLMELKSSYDSELIKLGQLQRQVNSALEDVRSVKDERLDEMIETKGFLEGEILQFRTLLENAELYSQLVAKERRLKNEVNELKAFIGAVENEQRKLKAKINKGIKEEGTYLLNNDLERQDEFKTASEFFIDYANNLAYLSNRYSKYSASSNFYLKVSARFAIFLASLSVERMRYPRFIFADNMEDKGIEEKRAQNLQKILIERLSDFAPELYQVIYTTSYITEELDNSPYVVGEFYTKENPTLKNISK